MKPFHESVAKMMVCMVIGSLVWVIVRLGCRLVVVVWCLCRIGLCRLLVFRMVIRVVVSDEVYVFDAGVNGCFVCRVVSSGEAGWCGWVFADELE